MKRIFLILLFIPILCVMSSCSPPSPELKDSFTIPLTVSGTLDCTAELTRSGDTLTLTLTSPEPLAGLSYTYDHGELTASYNGLSCTTDPSALPDTALPQLLYTVVADIENAAYLRSDEGGGVFQLHGAAVTIRGGLPIRIDVTDPRYSIRSN